MPTGYTNKVQDGSITELNNFVLTCARGFGALIMMRDTPSDAKIPEQFEPSDFDLKALKEHQARKAEIEAMSADAADDAAASEYKDRVFRNIERLAEIDAQKRRYEEMVDKVRGWEPPSEDHRELKTFMQQQLLSSIDFDCSGSLREIYTRPVERMTGAQWREKNLAELSKSIDRHAASHTEEIARTEGRNKWVRRLRESLSNRANA